MLIIYRGKKYKLNVKQLKENLFQLLLGMGIIIVFILGSVLCSPS